MKRYAALAVPHYRLVDPEDRWITCYRLRGETYQHIQRSEGDVILAPPDWPELSGALGDLWR